ncbi:MAG: DUF4129 domain-containing protein [Bacteroidota bacterium]
MTRTLLLITLLGAASAQDPPAPPPAPPKGVVIDDVRPEAVAVDSALLPAAALDPRPAPGDVLGAYRADPDFQYDRPEAAGPSLWQRFLAWLGRQIFGPIAENTTWEFWQWTLVLLGVAALGWVAARLLQTEGTGLFGRRQTSQGEVGPLLDVDDIAEVDLDALLGRALAEADHREAVRFRYLLVLQALDAVGAVAWRRDKTNRTYVAEARAHDAALGRPFADATRVFDYVWYGERAVDDARYAALAPLFDRVEAALAPAAEVR